MSLLQLCIRKAALMLIENFWPIGSYEFEEQNPFRAFPSNINEEIIAAVIRLIPSGTLTVKDLYPVLISGRVKNFVLEHISIDFEEFESILTALSLQGIHLNTLVLDVIYLKFRFDVQDKFRAKAVDKLHRPSSAIECLLALSPNLETVRIGIPFDLKAIQKVQALKHLELNFVPQSSLADIIPKVDDICIPNDTITYISTLKAPQYTISAEEVAFVLQHCTELKFFDSNVSEALEFLHSYELFEGSLSKQYKLEKLVLGDVAVFPNSAVASGSVIHIASITCPHLKELDVLVNDHQAVAALRYFTNLESFLIQWEPVMSSGDFRLSLQLVLENIGANLTKLSILNFCNVSFEVIGRFCPNLRYLKIEHEKETPSSITNGFKNLEDLQIETFNTTGISEETVLQLLSNCKNIKYLSLENIPCLNDHLLNKLLNVNPLSELKEAFLVDCRLQENGLKRLIETCKSLEFLKIFSPEMTFQEAADIVHSINPFIIMSE